MVLDGPDRPDHPRHADRSFLEADSGADRFVVVLVGISAARVLQMRSSSELERSP